jgi:hypothetical protein
MAGGGAPVVVAAGVAGMDPGGTVGGAVGGTGVGRAVVGEIGGEVGGKVVGVPSGTGTVARRESNDTATGGDGAALAPNATGGPCDETAADAAAAAPSPPDDGSVSEGICGLVPCPVVACPVVPCAVVPGPVVPGPVAAGPSGAGRPACGEDGVTPAHRRVGVAAGTGIVADGTLEAGTAPCCATGCAVGNAVTAVPDGAAEPSRAAIADRKAVTGVTGVAGASFVLATGTATVAG